MANETWIVEVSGEEMILTLSEATSEVIVISEAFPGPTGLQGVQGETGEGVPVGGAAGAVLTKLSATDYDTAWVTVRRAVTGSTGAPTAVVAAAGVAAPTADRTLAFISGSGGAVDLVANPQIAAGSVVGQEVTYRVPSGGNAVLFEDGNGLSMNGPANLGEDTFSITFNWDGALWFCSARD